MAPSTEPVKKFSGLPLAVVGPIDIGRLARELEMIDNNLLQQKLQKQELKLPKTSKMMDDMIAMNKLELLEQSERERLKQFLAVLKQRAPLLHMSFSADPTPAFVEELMHWLRKNIHPLVLLTVGLQPSIGAGCMVRTNNKYFDFSLAKNFSKNRVLLMAKLRGDAEAAARDAQTVVPAPVEAVG